MGGLMIVAFSVGQDYTLSFGSPFISAVVVSFRYAEHRVRLFVFVFFLLAQGVSCRRHGLAFFW